MSIRAKFARCVDFLQALARGAGGAAVVAGLLLALQGCGAVPPRGDTPRAVDVPPAWSASDASSIGSALPLAQWWMRFGDPLLAQLVTEALQANTSVLSAQAALRQARALRDATAAGLLPAVGGSASAQRGTAGGHSTGSVYRAGLDASWEIDVFGANRSALDTSEATARASAANLGDVQVSIAAEVGLSYLTLRSAQALLAIANDNLASQQETLQITQWRQQAGLVTWLEVEQARGAVEQTSAQIPALQTGIAQTSHALAVLTGRPPAALSALLADAGPLPQAPADLGLSIPAETLRQRPDVRAAEHQVSAAAARVAQAEAARLPAFKLSGTLGLNSLALGSLMNGASVVGALLAGVSMPVFDGGAGVAQVQAQQAALDEARLGYRATVLAALKEVEDALVALRGDRERLARLERAAEAAGNASLLASERFSTGLVDFQTVLETQRTQLTTQDRVASARADVSADHIRLYKALGGGWQPDAVDAPATPTAAAARTPLP
jgi:multidrug efflux system outer membrane protein